jgi:hypothetical protein
MDRKLLISFVSLTLLSLAATSCRKDQPSSTRDDISSVKKVRKDGTDHVLTKNVRYLVDQRSEGGNVSNLILREQIEIERDPRAEGSLGKIEVEASDGKKAWKLQAEGQQGDLQPWFYRTKLEGCCASPDEYTFYSLNSGAKVYKSNLPTLFLLSAENDRRFVTYLQTDDDRGLLQYGDDTHVINSIEIRSPENEGFPLVSAMSGDRKSWDGIISLDEQSVKAAPISITLTFFDVPPIVIELKDDRLSRTNVTLPKGFTIAEAQKEKAAH